MPNRFQDEFNFGGAVDDRFFQPPRAASDPNAEAQGRLRGKLSAGESVGTAFLKDSIATGRVLETRGEAMRARHATNVGAIGGRLRRVQAGANLAAQRAGGFRFSGPRGFSRQMEQAVKRGKARQGINERGDRAIRNQQLKDRITLARQSVTKRGMLMQTSENAARLRAGAQVSSDRASSQVNSAFAGAAGAIAGGAVRGFGDRFFNTGDLSSGIADQQADVDQFFGVGSGGVGGIDNTFDLPGFDFTLPPPTGLG